MPTWKPPQLAQPVKGYRYSVDAFLLAAFAERFNPDHFLDIGTGSGPIAARLLQLCPQSRAVAIERQPCLAQYAEQNLPSERSTLIRGDLRHIPWRSHIFDLIVCNPPYFEQGRGKLAHHSQRMAARHALHGRLDDFVLATRKTLKPGGHFCFVYPYLERERMLERLAHIDVHLSHLLIVSSFENEPPKLILGALKWDNSKGCQKHSLTLYKGHRDYTERAVQFLEKTGSL